VVSCPAEIFKAHGPANMIHYLGTWVHGSYKYPI